MIKRFEPNPPPQEIAPHHPNIEQMPFVCAGHVNLSSFRKDFRINIFYRFVVRPPEISTI
jgi:hypothetical protein